MRNLIAKAVAASVLFSVSAAPGYPQQTYPSARISMVVGFAPGGFADTLARVVAERMSRELKQTVTVENRDGAGGNIAAATIAGLPGDGYSILVTTTSIAISQAAYRKLGYSLTDLKPVAIPASSPEMIAVPAASPVRSLAEFVTLAKSSSGATFSTAGVGSGSQLAAQYFFKHNVDADITHVPFRGGALAIQAAISNQVDMVAASFGIAPQVQQGALRGLAVASPTRIEAAPDVPTYAELGFSDYQAASWVAFLVPASTPKPVIEKLNLEINKAISDPDVVKRLTAQGYVLRPRDTTEVERYFAAEISEWGTRVKSLGVTIE